jgi:AcrR family transcriptional regulator
MPRPSTRPHLLASTAELVLEHGLTELTLERAAAAAGVSKGGLLYHFPTKAALVAALIDDVLERFEAAVDELAAADDGPASWAHAYVDATFDAAVSRPELAAALLSGGDVDADVLGRCAGRMSEWQRRLEQDGLDPATAAVVRYACDGWWALGSLGPATTPSEIARLRARLHAEVESAVSG